MIAIGPYTFTATDALSTIAKVGALWDVQLEGRHSPAAVALGTALAGRLAVAVGESGPVDRTDLGDLGVCAASLLVGSPQLEPVLADVWTTLRAAADAARAEGHPISRGSAGENITVSGLPWEQVRPGVIVRIGTVLAHVQAYAEPCATNKAFFTDGDFQRMNINRGPVSRVYATVLACGRVAPGDPVILEPAG